MSIAFERYIGCDVHKDFMQVCVLDARGQTRLEQRVDMQQGLERFAQSLRPTDAVALEATTNAFGLHDLLAAHAGQVLIVHPLKAKLIATSRVKTDQVDARVLAQMLHSGFIPTVWVPPAHIRDLRGLLGLRTSLNKQGTRTKNCIHALARGRRFAFEGNDLFSQQGLDWLLQQPWSEPESFLLQHHLQLLQAINGQQAALEQRIAQLALDEPVVARLLQLHGLGFFSALAVVAEIGDITRFAGPRQLCSYAGLTPSVHQSGNGHAYYGSITKAGRKRLRWVLVEAVQAAARTEPQMARFFERIRARKGWNVAVVACARKLLVRIWHIWHEAQNARQLDPALYTRKLQALAWAAGKQSVRRQGHRSSEAFIRATCDAHQVALTAAQAKGRARSRAAAANPAGSQAQPPQPNRNALRLDTVQKPIRSEAEPPAAIPQQQPTTATPSSNRNALRLEQQAASQPRRCRPCPA